MLIWRELIPSNDQRRWVKGAELSQALCGSQSRYAIIMVRCYHDAAYKEPDFRYVVRDAFGVSDADVRAGKRPPIVFRTERLEDAIAFCLASA